MDVAGAWAILLPASPFPLGTLEALTGSLSKACRLRTTTHESRCLGDQRQRGLERHQDSTLHMGGGALCQLCCGGQGRERKTLLSWQAGRDGWGLCFCVIMTQHKRRRRGQQWQKPTSEQLHVKNTVKTEGRRGMTCL